MLRYLMIGTALMSASLPAQAQSYGASTGTELDSYWRYYTCDVDGVTCYLAKDFESSREVANDGAPSSDAGAGYSASASFAVATGGAAVAATSLVGPASIPVASYPYDGTYPNPPAYQEASSGTYIGYEFVIRGAGSAPTSVPVTIHSAFSESASGTGSGWGSLDIVSIESDYSEAIVFERGAAVGGGQYSAGLFGGSTGPRGLVTLLGSGNSFAVSFADATVLYANQLYYLSIEAMAKAVSDDGLTSGGSAYAFADPSIVIDPAYAAQYQIYGGLLGPPIPTVSGTPEPATWALLVAGFGLVGAAVRRRRVAVA